MGWSQQVEAINTAAVKLARQAADYHMEKQAKRILVAGAVGPLGVRLEPLGKTGLDEARAAFAEQIAALAAGGRRPDHAGDDAVAGRGPAGDTGGARGVPSCR